MLATVGSITHQSLRTATSVAHASAAIDGRFAALGRAHDLLTRASWDNATIDSTIRNAIEPFDQGGDRFTISGEDIRITSSSVIAFAMTLNELCTNTTKFGALSLPEGQVQIAWWVEGERPPLRMDRDRRATRLRADAQEFRDPHDVVARPTAAR